MCNEFSHRKWAIALIRITLGMIYVLHGCQKVFGWFGGTGYEGFVSWAASVGIPPFLAYTAPFAQLIGGILLTLGVLTALGGLLTTAVMLGALYYIHFGHGFVISSYSYEFLNFLIISTPVISFAEAKSITNWKKCCDKKVMCK